MTRPTTAAPVAGVDGCKGGWIAVTGQPPAEPPTATVFRTFAALVDALPDDAIVAVDMPIGLPDFIGKGGRGPEALVRRLLGQRQSSVFSIPSRPAVYAEPGPFAGTEDWYGAHRRASAVAMATSDPPRAVSIQAFGIFAKIRELDALLIERPDLRRRLFESHPEVAFWRLNGEAAMCQPKKIKSVVNPAGMEERKALLVRHGYARVFLDRAPPSGAAADDFLDAAAMMIVAGRIARGAARPCPDPPLADSHGIPIAIWS